MRFLRFVLPLILGLASAPAAPVFLDDRFELPPGFRIYRAATAELSGGSYDVAFDGQGRLLVGDGTAVRRLTDADSDGVYDRFEIIAEGLGPRGPQGLLVYDDKLYATGGDGVQLYTGVLTGGPLLHRGRIGEKFSTGGDHTAHTLLRGIDGHVYFNTGDGAGIRDRAHITEASSPVLFERKASVYRIDPNGREWECVSAGGRNPPSLGMNYLGELFSWDSDMEWHVDLPFYRPVRLNHWIVGADQGWQSVGAYPPYYIDNVPPVTEIGRGSPTWGVFYEHFQFPEKYADSFIVCDYRWKSATSGGYDSAGRLVSFHLKRNGATWDAKIETLARPKPGARDENDTPINFALVDVEVAPDGSLFVTDHNQGIWRILYDPAKQAAGPPVFDFRQLARFVPDLQRMQALEAVMLWPQPGAEWSRTTIENIHSQSAGALAKALQDVALNESAITRKRMRAIRLLASEYRDLPSGFLARLSLSEDPDARAQSAFLLGLRDRDDEIVQLQKLLRDTDPFVRRRAAEAFTRISTDAANDGLIERLSDSDRTVRYVAMSALAHRPPEKWIALAMKAKDPQTLMRALIAYSIRREPPPAEILEDAISRLLDHPGMTSEDRLDFLRILGIHRDQLADHSRFRAQIVARLVERFPDGDKNIRWEQARLIGDYQNAQAAPTLLSALEKETDGVTQFHFAQSVARLASALNPADGKRAADWFLKNQRGWFSEFDGKGRQFPDFWATTLARFVEGQGAILAERLGEIDLGGQLGGLVLEWIGDRPDGGQRLVALHDQQSDPDLRQHVIRALRKVRQPAIADFLRSQLRSETRAPLRGALLQSLANQAVTPADAPALIAGLAHEDPDVAGDCAMGLARAKPELDQSLAGSLLNLFRRHASLAAPADQALRALAKAESPWAKNRPRRPNDEQRRQIIAFWDAWHIDRFGRPFTPTATGLNLRSNEELFAFLNSDASQGGDAKRGKDIFAKAQCAECHGGGGKPGVLFGPDLAGVTQRLKRAELAEAIAWPSRVVVERYKAMEVELKNGESLTGFVTEQDDRTVTLATKEKIHRLARRDVSRIHPQELSLMPEGLTAPLSDQDLRDLLRYLETLRAAD